ncbi:MAG: hypothetical protein HY925_10640, partial [Elusimicrobia bacterium]|nr:hypothetical protein [Elusimicrobiota bacterium]
SPIPGPSPTPTPTPAQRCGYDAIICGLYQKYLHRLPDDAGARYWQIRLAELRKAGVPQNQLENHLTAPFIGGIWEDELKKLDEKR